MDIIVVPFAWLLNLLYSVVHNYGLAVILFALIIKLILLPFGMKSKKSMMRTAEFQPKMKELEKKYEGNKAKYNEELAKLYKEENIKPLGGCLWSLIPFPILIALYTAIRQPYTKLMNLTVEQFVYLKDNICSALGFAIENVDINYEQIRYAQKIHQNFDSVSNYINQNAESIKNAVGSFNITDMNFSFLGMNLAENPNWRFFLDAQSWSAPDILPQIGLFLIPLISAALAFLSTKISQKMSNQSTEMAGGMKGMLYVMPLVSVWFGFIMPAVVGVYWIASSLLSMIQDVALTKYYGKKLEAERLIREEVDRLRHEQLEKKRLETERLRAANATTPNPNTSKRKKQNIVKSQEEQKSADWEAAHGLAKKKPDSFNPSQVGDRPFARGRNYDPARFTNSSNLAPPLPDDPALLQGLLNPTPTDDSTIEDDSSAPVPLDSDADKHED